VRLRVCVRRHPEAGERRLDPLRWGLRPRWAKAEKVAREPINARAETVATNGMFRQAYARRRCLVPAGAFYEWKALDGGKQPVAIAPAYGRCVSVLHGSAVLTRGAQHMC
jgi:putative SOS response-associated peptidase YedK